MMGKLQDIDAQNNILERVRRVSRTDVFYSDTLRRINKMNKTAADILGNPDYLAISYGGYRENTRDIQPTVEQIKEDMKILAAMGVKILRDYNVQLQHAPNLLKAINQLKDEDADFEM